MLAVKKILVPIDFSQTSMRVLEFARMLADACGASLELLHVIGYPMENGQAIEQQRRDACRRLDAMLDSTDGGRTTNSSSPRHGRWRITSPTPIWRRGASFRP
jgi:hypothetical protein